MSLRRAACLEDVWSGEKIGVVIDGVKVLLVNVEGVLHAYEDRCAHQAVPLSEGRLDGRVLTCSAHEWQYDVCTGLGINPQGVALCRLPLEVRGEDVLVDTSPAIGARR
jgi:toluene monooxygenase system ferredoxin subunit